MKKVVLTITSTEQRPLPAGQSFGGFRFRLTAPSGSHADSAITSELSFGFDDPDPGLYTATLFVLDSSGAELAPALTTTVEVLADPPPTPLTYPHPLGFAAAVITV